MHQQEGKQFAVVNHKAYNNLVAMWIPKWPGEAIFFSSRGHRWISNDSMISSSGSAPRPLACASSSSSEFFRRPPLEFQSCFLLDNRTAFQLDILQAVSCPPLLLLLLPGLLVRLIFCVISDNDSGHVVILETAAAFCVCWSVILST